MRSVRFFSGILTDLLYILTVIRAWGLQKNSKKCADAGIVLVSASRVPPGGSKLLAMSGSEKTPLKMGR
jgi:hypothetical protein